MQKPTECRNPETLTSINVKSLTRINRTKRFTEVYMIHSFLPNQTASSKSCNLIANTYFQVSAGNYCLHYQPSDEQIDSCHLGSSGRLEMALVVCKCLAWSYRSRHVPRMIFRLKNEQLCKN